MTRTMRRRIWTAGSLLLLIAIFTLAWASARAATPQQAAKLHIIAGIKEPFTATVLQGPDRGLALTGTLRVQILSSGVITGTLRAKSRLPLPVTGQLKGQLIALYFNLGKDRNIFGTGILGYDRFAKHNVIGGTFTGPSDLSTGVWEVHYLETTAAGGCLLGIPSDDGRPGLCITIS